MHRPALSGGDVSKVGWCGDGGGAAGNAKEAKKTRGEEGTQTGKGRPDLIIVPHTDAVDVKTGEKKDDRHTAT